MNLINKIQQVIRQRLSGEISVKRFLPGIAWFFILSILLCIPGKDLGPPNAFLEMIYFDKWVHIGMFAMLAFLFIAPVMASDLQHEKKRIYTLIIMLLISAWGLVTELIQMQFIEGRSFDIFDWLSDSLGVVIAFYICRYIFTPQHNNI